MITIERLKFAYHRGGWLFRDFSLSLTEGHIVGLLGANGTGKSTLLKLICGMLSSLEGEVLLCGAPTAERKVEQMGRLMVVPEEFQLPNITIESYAKANAPFYPNFDYGQLEEALKAFEVDTSVRLGAMSMGQRKKAFIAFAMACNTDILLLDEPTNGLDIPSKGVFRRLLAAWATPERLAVVSTHQVKDVENLIDHIVMIDRKGLVIDASTYTISQRLSFEMRPTAEGAIYGEAALGGYSVVAENTSAVESNIDIELLFNAAKEARTEIKEILTNH
ncbi:MAG: ABC transporter ATP-binding protein [Tidjanibacter sp.]|nr:ABC transporter ATP-binding protein [Tidjanibacter sp.]